MNHINSPYCKMIYLYLHSSTKNNWLCKGLAFVYISIYSSSFNSKKALNPFIINTFHNKHKMYSILHIASVFLRICKSEQVYSILRIKQNLF
jgi:hypothetical protein